MKDKRIKEIKRLKEGECFHGEVWYTCPHCGKGIEAHSIAESDDNIHICSSCGGKYYYSRFEKI